MGQGFWGGAGVPGRADRRPIPAFSLGFATLLSKPVQISRTTSVSQKHIEATRAAAKVLREKPVVRPETVTGLIIDLHSRHDSLGLFSGSKADQNIVMVWRPEGYSEIPVSVSLSQDDYLKAVGAHREGLPVTVKGMLEQRDPRSWVLSNVSSFSKVD